jgi:hypothetical protein
MRPIVKKMMQQGFKFKNITSTKWSTYKIW